MSNETQKKRNVWSLEEENTINRSTKLTDVDTAFEAEIQIKNKKYKVRCKLGNPSVATALIIC